MRINYRGARLFDWVREFVESSPGGAGAHAVQVLPSSPLLIAEVTHNTTDKCVTVIRIEDSLSVVACYVIRSIQLKNIAWFWFDNK